MRRVVIIYKTLPHYRVSFFDQLRVLLNSSGIELELLVGQPDDNQALKKDTSELAWAQRVKNRYFKVGRRTLVWQPVLKRTRGADLVIVEQASRLLVNYLLIGLRWIRGSRIAFWGHGVNLDADSSSWLGEAIKHLTVRTPDWWFAYTDSTAAILTSRGVHEDKITVVQNAIDTDRLRALNEGLSTAQRASIRATLGMSPEDVAGVFIGSIYGSKRLPFLIDSCDIIRSELPTFHLIVVGEGPDSPVLQAKAADRPWVHVVGQKRDLDLVEICSAADMFLMPGLVGLAILDAFALGLPVVTTAVSYHSPEISYLIDGVNGLSVKGVDSAESYAAEVVGLFTDETRRLQMRDNCLKASEEYTVEEMARRFADGIRAALEVE